MSDGDVAGTPAGRTAISRRRFLRSAAAVTGAAVVGGVVGAEGIRLIDGATSSSTDPSAGRDASRLVPFRAAHQAGIATPAQDRLAFAAFDVVGGVGRAGLADLMRRWTTAAERMCQGQPVGDVAGMPLAPPLDTGEAAGLAAADLTLTVGYGPSLFDDRFGLASSRPSVLVDLPRMPGDVLEPGRSGGDVAIQACADDPQVAFHAVRNLARLARGVLVMRWFQSGFGRTSSTSVAQVTPRNLMGFKDGTNNIVAEDAAAMAADVWVGADTDQPWMRDGSYLVTRRIRMRIESWDRTSLDEQERVFGRDKIVGAPLGAVAERDAVDLGAHHGDGSAIIDATAHIRLAAPSQNGGIRILRRGYSYTDGIDPVTGELDAGLFFVAFQRDPGRQFVPLQQRLSATDALNEYIRHTGSAVFACPPGPGPGDDWGSTLFA